MGYIIKAPTGGGGGGDATAANQVLQLGQDATAANQLIEINQLIENSGEASVLKDTNDQSVFLDNTNLSVFRDLSGNSNLYYNQSVAQSAFNTEANTLGTSNGVGTLTTNLNNSFTNNGSPTGTNLTSVQTFTSTTLAGVGALLQTFLRAPGVLAIKNISFSSGGATQHDVILVYISI
jgi:hypothetical protein